MSIKNKILDFIAPAETDGDETTVEYDEADPKPISVYENQKSSKTKLPTNAQLVLFDPRNLEESQTIADHLKQGKACVVNLHRLQREYCQRTIDYLTGVLYALDGTIEKIGHNIILCAPKSVGVDGAITLESDEE